MTDPESAETHDHGLAEQAGPVDGRHARRERGRLAVVDATIDLLLEGHAPPTAELVAERAGVSESSLFRYFETLDELQLAASARVFVRFADLFEIERIGEGSRGGRISRHVVARIELYEAVHPILRFARARSINQPNVDESLRSLRRRHVEQIRTQYAPELRRRTRATADDLVLSLAAVTSFDSWDQLTFDVGRSARLIRRGWETAIDRLL